VVTAEEPSSDELELDEEPSFEELESSAEVELSDELV
jgi:hypothetical protein